jgi:GNAT superfamily N-acetyltransferase
MIANYTDNPQLFERCINLINEVFPGCKEFALNGIKYKASWPEGSTPFIVEKNGEIIAHAGVWPLTLMLNGKEHRTASIHGVCVKPEHRGKGYFKQLMQEAMQYVDNHFDSSILFTVKPYLYKSYPYKAMLPEYDFVVSEKLTFKSKDSDLRILSLDNADDLNLVHQLLSHRVPLSNQLSVINKNGNALFVLNTLHEKLHYSEKLKALIIFKIVNNTLYIKEIVSQKQHQMNDIIESISGHFEKIVLQFCPDNFLDEKDYAAILAGPECCIMVSDKFSFTDKYFRFPELYWC